MNKDEIILSIDNLIKKYNGWSCIKIFIFSENSYGKFIEYNFNQISKKYNKAFSLKINNDFLMSLIKLLSNYIKNCYQYCTKEEWDSLISSDIFMFTLNDWKQMANEYG